VEDLLEILIKRIDILIEIEKSAAEGDSIFKN
jgi:hypothetical protein